MQNRTHLEHQTHIKDENGAPISVLNLSLHLLRVHQQVQLSELTINLINQSIKPLHIRPEHVRTQTTQ